MPAGEVMYNIDPTIAAPLPVCSSTCTSLIRNLPTTPLNNQFKKVTFATGAQRTNYFEPLLNATNLELAANMYSEYDPTIVNDIFYG